MGGRGHVAVSPTRPPVTFFAAEPCSSQPHHGKVSALCFPAWDIRGALLWVLEQGVESCAWTGEDSGRLKLGVRWVRNVACDRELSCNWKWWPCLSCDMPLISSLHLCSTPSSQCVSTTTPESKYEPPWVLM